jgi:hypothetical protein
MILAKRNSHLSYLIVIPQQPGYLSREAAAHGFSFFVAAMLPGPQKKTPGGDVT